MNKKVIALIAVIAIVAILGVCLVACNAKSYQSKLEKKGYKVTVETDYDKDSKYEWSVTGVKAEISLTNASADSVSIVKFKSLDDAKQSEKNAKDNGITVKRSGKIVIAGTEQGVKDAK